MTLEQRLSAIQSRLEAVTPGPWSNTLLADDDLASMSAKGQLIEGENCGIAITVESGTRDDARLIAHAPSDLAFLTAALSVACEALETYADKKLWEGATSEYGVSIWLTNDDRGNEAREALAEIERISRD